MKPSILGVSALAVVLLGPLCIAADEPAKSQSAENAQAAQASEGASTSQRPTRTRASTRAQSPRLTKPWRDLGSLSDEQKKQIADIHRKAVQDKKTIEDRETADIMALLNDQQKGELKTLQDKEAADRKVRAANRPAANTGSGRGAASGSTSTDKSTDRSADDSTDKLGNSSSKAAEKEATAAPAK